MVSIDNERASYADEDTAELAVNSLLDSGVMGGPNGWIAVVFYPDALLPWTLYVGPSQ